jgi:NAD(P)H-flavin reductase
MPTVAQGATVGMAKSKTHDILAIRQKLDDRSAFRFAAGQYLSLAMPGAPARHYSMASRPDEELVELHVRLVPGGRTSSLIHASLKAGDRVEIEGPAGSAYLRDTHGGPVVAVAGGSGLAPIRSIVETALGAGMNQPIHLYFGARTEDDLYLVDHFRALEQRFSTSPSCRSFHRLSKQAGAPVLFPKRWLKITGNSPAPRLMSRAHPAWSMP